MTVATESLDLTGVLELLPRWRRVAWSSGDRQAHRRMLEHAERLNTGVGVATESWQQTKARLGLQVYIVETDSDAVDQVDALPASALPAYAELMTLLDLVGAQPRRRWSSPVCRRPLPTVRTACPIALREPTSTTSRLARVTAV